MDESQPQRDDDGAIPAAPPPVVQGKSKNTSVGHPYGSDARNLGSAQEVADWMAEYGISSPP